MQFLIFILLGLSISLYFTFSLLKKRESWRYLVFLVLVDTWLSIVLIYLLYSAWYDT
jgi:hypothetical protein